MVLFLAGSAWGYYRRGPETSFVNSASSESSIINAPAAQPPVQSKQIDYDKLYNESMDWFPSDTPPIIKAFLQNPDDDKLAALTKKYLSERTSLAVKAEEKLTPAGSANTGGVSEANFFTPSSSPEDILKRLVQMGNDGWIIKYFYSDACPFCQKSIPYIKIISRFISVEKIEAQANAVFVPQIGQMINPLFLKWRVERTPTTFFIKGKKAYKMVGVLNDETLSNFLNSMEQMEAAGQ